MKKLYLTVAVSSLLAISAARAAANNFEQITQTIPCTTVVDILQGGYNDAYSRLTEIVPEKELSKNILTLFRKRVSECTFDFATRRTQRPKPGAIGIVGGDAVVILDYFDKQVAHRDDEQNIILQKQKLTSSVETSKHQSSVAAIESELQKYEFGAWTSSQLKNAADELSSALADDLLTDADRDSFEPRIRALKANAVKVQEAEQKAQDARAAQKQATDDEFRISQEKIEREHALADINSMLTDAEHKNLDATQIMQTVLVVRAKLESGPLNDTDKKGFDARLDKLIQMASQLADLEQQKQEQAKASDAEKAQRDNAVIQRLKKLAADKKALAEAAASRQQALNSAREAALNEPTKNTYDPDISCSSELAIKTLKSIVDGKLLVSVGKSYIKSDIQNVVTVVQQPERAMCKYDLIITVQDNDGLPKTLNATQIALARGEDATTYSVEKANDGSILVVASQMN